MTSCTNIETGRNHSCLFVCCRVSLFSVSSNSNWHQHLRLNELNEKRKVAIQVHKNQHCLHFFSSAVSCFSVCLCVPAFLSLIQFHSTFTQSSYMLLLLKKMCSSVSEKWEWKIFQNFLKLSFSLWRRMMNFYVTFASNNFCETFSIKDGFVPTFA